MKKSVHLFVSLLLVFATVFSLSSCSFKNGKIKSLFSFLYDCKTCYDEGVIECATCEGENVTNCTLCDGSGERECDVCSGWGWKKCGECGGTGKEYIGILDPLPFDCVYCTAGYASCPKTMSCGCVNGKRACVDCGASGLYDCPDCEQ